MKRGPLRKFFGIYSQYIRIAFSAAAAYRPDFFLGLLIHLAGNMLLPLLTILIYANGAAFPGWSFHESLLIQSVFMLSMGVCAPFFGNMVWMTMDYVREGTYDLLMLKPGSPIFITVAGSFGFEHTGALAGGIVMFVYSMANRHAPPFSGMLLFILLFTMGVCLYLGCILLMSAACFKWVGNSRLFEIYDALAMFGRYPSTIFSGTLRAAVTYAVPVAMLGFLPATALLGRVTGEMLFGSLACLAFLAMGWGVYRRMLYLYQSAGG